VPSVRQANGTRDGTPQDGPPSPPLERNTRTAETLREHKDNAALLFASGRLEEALAEYQYVAKAAPEDLASRQKVDGHESQYPVLREGDLFGEPSVLLGLPATATVSTYSPCTLLRLDRQSVERHILVQPGVREALSKLRSERLQRTGRSEAFDTLFIVLP
jgi:cyclic nucleotide-binding protein